MSYLDSKNVQCETVQNILESEFQTCPTPQESMPFLLALLQTQKAAGISQSVSDDGKVKTVKVTYEQRVLESAVTKETGTRVCSITNPTYNNYTTYTIDPSTYIKYGESFSIDELATVCIDPATFYARKIAKIIDVLERSVATQTAQQLVGLTGNWGSGVTVNGSNEFEMAAFISNATKAIDYTSMAKLDLAFMLTGYCANPIIVGGAELFQYGQYVNHGCCSSTGVNILDMANAYGKAILFDKRVATALGSQAKSIAFQPGSLALITYNKYNATEMTGGASNYTQYKFFSPRTGLPIDVVVSDNCGVISIIGYVTTKLVGLPTDMFAVGDEYRGVNFVEKIKVVNPA